MIGYWGCVQATQKIKQILKNRQENNLLAAKFIKERQFTNENPLQPD